MRRIAETEMKDVLIAWEDDDFEEHEEWIAVPKTDRGNKIVRDFANLYNLSTSQIWIKKMGK